MKKKALHVGKISRASLAVVEREIWQIWTIELKAEHFFDANSFL